MRSEELAESMIRSYVEEQAAHRRGDAPAAHPNRPPSGLNHKVARNSAPAGDDACLVAGAGGSAEVGGIADVEVEVIEDSEEEVEADGAQGGSMANAIEQGGAKNKTGGVKKQDRDGGAKKRDKEGGSRGQDKAPAGPAAPLACIRSSTPTDTQLLPYHADPLDRFPVSPSYLAFFAPFCLHAWCRLCTNFFRPYIPCFVRSPTTLRMSLA